MVAPQEVSYYSDGLKIGGYLVRPEGWQEGDPPRPGILCLPGYGGRTDIYLMPILQRLASEGWFALGIFYRGYGLSEGAPGRLRPYEECLDAYNGLTFLQTLAGVAPDRIGLFGTSMGGGNAIWVAAHDERVRCVVSSVGVMHGERWLESVRRPWEWYAFKDEVAARARERVRTGKSQSVPVQDIYLVDPHTEWVRQNYTWKGANFRPAYDEETVEETMRFRPEWVADRISPRPVLIISAERDGVVPPSQQLACFERCGEPKKLVKLPGARHYESYEFISPEGSALAMAETVAWYCQYL